MSKDVFQRIELKYMLDERQYRELFARLQEYARVDQYGETTIMNIYFDTPDYHLIRTSIDKPKYKEKLRLRSYGMPTAGSPAFIEIKKKYAGVVYKRRIEVPYKKAESYLYRGGQITSYSKSCSEQITKEIDYMRVRYNGLIPAMAISYDRIAMAGIEDPELRITFDRNIRWRSDDLSLTDGPNGRQLLKPEQHLMELKIAGAIPLWLSHLMDELQIRQTSFSKYGEAYLAMRRDQMKRPGHFTEYGVRISDQQNLSGRSADILSFKMPA